MRPARPAPARTWSPSRDRLGIDLALEEGEAGALGVLRHEHPPGGALERLDLDAPAAVADRRGRLVERRDREVHEPARRLAVLRRADAAVDRVAAADDGVARRVVLDRPAEPLGVEALGRVGVRRRQLVPGHAARVVHAGGPAVLAYADLAARGVADAGILAGGGRRVLDAHERRPPR